MIDIYGEILADLIGTYEHGILKFERYAGGAPFNVACGIEKLGGDVTFHGAVGSDLMGNYLKNFAKEQIGNDRIKIETLDQYNTTLAFVENNLNGERFFNFFRKNTADYHLQEINEERLKKAHILHIGSLMLSQEEGINFAKKLIGLSKKYHKIISFDINLREDLFESTEQLKKAYAEIIPLCDLLKFSEDELRLLTGCELIEDALKGFRKDQVIFVTLGKEGSFVSRRGHILRMGSIPVNPVDTTGAGDAFYAYILKNLDGRDIQNISDEELIAILKGANVCGALTTLKRGAIDAFPSLEEIKKYL